MTLRTWPKRIRLEQAEAGKQKLMCFDADTGEKLEAVLQVTIDGDGARVSVTMSKYDPHEAALYHPTGQNQGGLAVETSDYPITKLQLEAGG